MYTDEFITQIIKWEKRLIKYVAVINNALLACLAPILLCLAIVTLSFTLYPKFTTQVTGSLVIKFLFAHSGLNIKSKISDVNYIKEERRIVITLKDVNIFPLKHDIQRTSYFINSAKVSISSKDILNLNFSGDVEINDYEVFVRNEQGGGDHNENMKDLVAQIIRLLSIPNRLNITMYNTHINFHDKSIILPKVEADFNKNEVEITVLDTTSKFPVLTL